MDSLNSQFAWNKNQVLRLMELYNEGHSTAEIGRRMGITKNAVVGKASRLVIAGQLQGRGGPKNIREARDRRLSGTPRVQPRRHIIRAPVDINGPVLFFPAARPTTETELLAITASGETCRFPLWGDLDKPTQRFCGNPRLLVSSYCASHDGVCVKRRICDSVGLY